MDLTFQVPMKYCSLQHWTLLPSPITTTSRCYYCFGSVSSFFLSGVISPVISSSILGTYRSGKFIFLPFHSIHGVLKAKILKWFAIPFSSRPCFVRTLHHDLSVLGGPIWHDHSFIELDKSVVHVIRLVVFCDCGFQSVCPLMHKDKRLMQASYWERLTERETGSCSDGWGHAQ